MRGVHLRRMLPEKTSILSNLLIAMLILASPQVLVGQESAREQSPSTGGKAPIRAPLDESGKLANFQRDVAPILRSRCLACHGPQDAKNEFRVDDPEILLDYVEANDVESSPLYTDYLTTDDEDLLMPPAAKGGPLTPGELALIRVWIEEGANWPDDYQLVDAKLVEQTQPVESRSLTDRLWVAIGYLHPATIHFPIALFLLGAVFTVVGWKWPQLGTQIPLTCLLIGTASAIAAAAMGWSLAPTKGYGAGWEFLSFEREVDAHRWSGTIVTLVACLSTLAAGAAYWKDSAGFHKIWRAGLLFCGITVGLVGHQGGEMTYGRDFYPEMLRVLLGEVEDLSNKVANPDSESPVAESGETNPRQDNES